MKRIGAHYLYINPDILLKNGVVEIDDNGVVTDYFSLNDVNVESSNTEFYTGFLAPAFFPKTIIHEATATSPHELKEIALRLWNMQQEFPNATIVDFLKFESVSIEKDKQTEIWLFENVNLVDLKITPETTVDSLLFM